MGTARKILGILLMLGGAVAMLACIYQGLRANMLMAAGMGACFFAAVSVGGWLMLRVAMIGPIQVPDHSAGPLAAYSDEWRRSVDPSRKQLLTHSVLLFGVLLVLAFSMWLFAIPALPPGGDPSHGPPTPAPAPAAADPSGDTDLQRTGDQPDP